MTVSHFFRIFASNMYKIRRLLVWLRRFRHSRGFGIQSPFAYQFVRYVINEHYPYYAYEELIRQMPGVDRETHKLGRLYFRISNWLQPVVGLNFSTQRVAFNAYLTAGCYASRVKDIDVSLASDEIEELLRREASQKCLVRVTPEGNYMGFCRQILNTVHVSSVLVVEQIYKNVEIHRFWHSICDHERVTMSFDLYYCGVILFEKKHYKQHYIINF